MLSALPTNYVCLVHFTAISNRINGLKGRANEKYGACCFISCVELSNLSISTTAYKHLTKEMFSNYEHVNKLTTTAASEIALVVLTRSL